MKVVFIKPRQGYGYFAGDIANLPEETAEQLIREGFVTRTDVEFVVDSDLPADLPARHILIDSGLVNKADVLAASETLTDIKGIGKSTAEKIVSLLNV